MFLGEEGQTVDDEYPATNLKLRREQRKFFRFPVEGEAFLFLQGAGASLRCGMTDLGLEGCRLRRDEEIPVPVGAPVEVTFRLAGTNFRFAGVLQWSAHNQVLGIQFQKMSAARRQELADLLGGLREELDARQKEAAQRVAATLKAANTTETDKKPGGLRRAAILNRDRRQHVRHTVDGTAKVRFLSLHSQAVGKIIDLSMGGCRIRSEEVIPVGAFRRVEVEFLLRGTPLLLPGVTQALHDKHTVGIRFVEVTDRKREQLREVIEELEQGIAS